MVQVRMAMVPAMECLMLAGVAEALVLAEASVRVSAEAGAGAEADLAISSRFKLASNCRKNGYYARR